MNDSITPGELADGGAYERWRDGKLAAYSDAAQFPVVELVDAGHPSKNEVTRLGDLLRTFNMVLYAGKPEPLEQARQSLRSLGLQLGLKRLDANLCADEDAITPLAVSEGNTRRRYIPYTNRPISWHTDGYYNPPDRQIRAMALHCVSPAATGGATQLMDPDIAYILLREENPDFIRALMHAQAMTIPANEEGVADGGGVIRPAQSGPVFSFDPGNGALHMRYTARTRSIEWRNDDTTSAAVKFLADILNKPSPYVLDHRLVAGQGVICNNVLHNRSDFEDTDACQRMILRARYYDRTATILKNQEPAP